MVISLSKKSISNLLRVLVTGGSGFIGSKLVERLVSRGYSVTCLLRSDNSKNQKVNVVKGDLCLPNFLFSDQYDVGYHLAAVWPGEKDKKIQRTVNYDGTVNLFSAIKDKTKSFVYVSGLGIFGDPKDKVIDETSSLNPNTEYAKTRLEAQKFLTEKCEQNGIAFSVVYLGDVYGNGGWFKSMVIDRLKKGSFRIPGSGKYYRSFVHVDDVVSALVSIAEKKVVNESFIITDSNPVMFSEFVSFLSSKLGVKMPGTLPIILAKAVLGSDFVNLLTTSIKTSNSKISRICNFEYPSYQDGIAATLSEIKL